MLCLLQEKLLDYKNTYSIIAIGIEWITVVKTPLKLTSDYRLRRLLR